MKTALKNNVISRTKSITGLVTDFVRTNPIISGGAVALGGSAIVTGLVVAARKRKKKSKTASKTRKSRKKTTKKKGTIRRKTKGRRTPRTAGKGKDTSTKRIRYTSKGQPYVLMKSGKAKFIKKTSAKRSHRQKGGRY